MKLWQNLFCLWIYIVCNSMYVFFNQNTIFQKIPTYTYRFEITLFHSCSELVSNNICVCDVCFFALLLPLMSKHYWLASCTIHVVLSHRFWTFWQVIQLGIYTGCPIWKCWNFDSIHLPPFIFIMQIFPQAIHQLQIGHPVQYTTL